MTSSDLLCLFNDTAIIEITQYQHAHFNAVERFDLCMFADYNETWVWLHFPGMGLCVLVEDMLLSASDVM